MIIDLELLKREREEAHSDIESLRNSGLGLLIVGSRPHKVLALLDLIDALQKENEALRSGGKE